MVNDNTLYWPSVCVSVAKTSPEFLKEEKMCCLKDKNYCSIPPSDNKDLNHCYEGTYLTKCRTIEELAGGACQRGDNLAKKVCDNEKDALFCLSVNETNGVDYRDEVHKWMIGRNRLVDSYASSCACCQATFTKDGWVDDDNCTSIGNVIDPKNCNLKSCPNSEIIVSCSDLFQSGGGKCQVFYPNGTKQGGKPIQITLPYQAEVCDLSNSVVDTTPTNSTNNNLSVGEITGIVIGVASLIVALVGLFIARKQLSLDYRKYRQRHSQRRESIELNEQTNRERSSENNS